MPALNIAGTDYDVRTSSEQEQSEFIGKSVRAFSGRLRSSKRAEKRKWSVDLAPMTDAAYNTLRTATYLGAQVTVSGDIIGASLTCEVVIETSQYIRDGGAAFQRLVTITIEEV